MPYCPRCGVEAAASVRQCPLCATAIPVLDDLASGAPTWPGRRELSAAQDPTLHRAPKSVRRARAFGAVAAVFTTAAVAVVGVDLATNRGFVWSLWPLASLVAVFLAFAAVFAWPRRPGRWVPAWALLSILLLAAFDALGDTRWFLALGLPITAGTWALLGLAALAVARSRRRGWDIPAAVTALLGLELVQIDWWISHYLALPDPLGWSLICALVFGPLAGLFTVLNLVFRRPPAFDRVFHL